MKQYRDTDRRHSDPDTLPAAGWLKTECLDKLANMATPDEIRETIRQFLQEHFPSATVETLEDHSSLIELGVIDSIGILDVLSFLEREFQVTIRDAELGPHDFESIAALTQLVDRHLARLTERPQ